MSTSPRKLVVLDRDGVINADSDEFIKSPDEWHPLPGSLEAIAKLNQAGYRVVVATNQSGIGRGLFGMNTLNSIHAKMHRAAADVGGRIDAVFFCPHTAAEKCGCRKPGTGLLEEIVARYDIDRAGTPMVGDAARDIEAALNAGFDAHLVRSGKGMRTLAQGPLPEGVHVHDDLADFVRGFLAKTEKAS
ncbi:MAG: D-glycero-beta-D-manno-heptose 1,7-bisphosphate 7-phosphatase [Janthinobacterium lividum]